MASANVTISDTEPLAPANGDLWWSSADGQLYIFYNDGTSSQWIIAASQGGLPPHPPPPADSGIRHQPGEEPDYLEDNPDIKRLYDNIQALVAGVTYDMLRMETWNTIEDFYQRTTLRREHVYWIMQPGVMTLDFDPFDSHWRVCRMMQFRGLYNARFEPPGRVRDLQTPVPDNVRKGEITLALKPKDIDVPLPYDIWSQWFDTLCAGVMYRLYLQPMKPYSSVQAARLYAAMYTSGVGRARALVQNGNLTEGVTWRFPLFATGHPKGLY
jgi:hypothetical protein